METIKTTSRIHPLVAVAAVAVIALSGVGIAAITGVLPTSHGSISSPSNVTNPAVSSAENLPIANYAGAPPDSNAPPPPPPTSAMAPQGPPPDYRPAAICSSCGTVESVHTVEHHAKPSGVGAVAGALLGGVIGNRFGGGNGRVLTTVGGAVGGGLAGNEIEKRTHTSSSYVVQVRMENGKLRSFPSATQPGWNVGDRVKISDGRLIARN